MSEVLRNLPRPIIAAPMAGGPSTPALVSAVGAAGGMGFLPAGYVSAERLAAAIDDVRGDAAFGVNVFVPESPAPGSSAAGSPAPGGAAVDESAVVAYAQRLEEEAQRLGVTLGEARYDDDGYAEKLSLLGERRVPVVSFTFGLPAPAEVAALHARGSEVWVTVTDPDTASAAAQLGADALIVQGVEAGGHRGGPDDTDGLTLLPLLRLVAARTSLPMVAAGGIMDGAAVAAVLAAGAAVAQLGTAFLGCPEAGTAEPHRDLLGSARATQLTRAFTGRTARGIVNRFLLAHDEAAPAAYPHVHHLTSPLRAAARNSGDAETMHLWAGQAHPLIRRLPAADLVEQLTTETRTAVQSLAALSFR